MADQIITIPALVTSVDAAEHELTLSSNLFPPLTSEIILVIEVTVGVIQLSIGRSITGGSATFAAASNGKTIVTLPPGASIFYKATTTGDAFTISL